MAEYLPTEAVDTAPIIEPDVSVVAPPTHKRRRVGIWGLLLIIVIVCGYLTAARREALGKLVEQIADIVRDFRGYDPEF